MNAAHIGHDLECTRNYDEKYREDQQCQSVRREEYKHRGEYPLPYRDTRIIIIPDIDRIVRRTVRQCSELATRNDIRQDDRDKHNRHEQSSNLHYSLNRNVYQPAAPPWT